MFERLFILFAVFAAQSANISIVSPQPGDILRGAVEIVGNMNVPNFVSAELAFSYAAYPGDTWFTIQTFSQPVTDPVIAVWDTAAVTDGDYILHLRVFLQDGSSQDVVVSDLKIRNDEPPTVPSPTLSFPSPFSTPLPAWTAQPVTALPTFPSPTPLPANPASVPPSLIYLSFGRGIFATLVLFALFALILRLRKG